MANDNKLLENIKSCFETSNSKIFVNLHKASSKKAASVLNLEYNPDSINTFMINTGITTDGVHLDDKLYKSDEYDVGKFFSNKDGKYEMGIVLQFTDFKAPTPNEIQELSGDFEQVFQNKNRSGFEKLKKAAYEAIQEYFRWFAGADISQNLLVEFIPHYNGGEIRCKDYKIEGMDDNEKQEYFMSRFNLSATGDEETGENFVPRVGWKVGYTISYKESKKQSDIDAADATGEQEGNG